VLEHRTQANPEKATLARYRLPPICPVCEAATVRLEGESVTRCPNIDCPAQLKNNLRHLAGRSALDIEGLGEKLIDQLVTQGLVSRLSDLFTLSAETLEGLERMGARSAANLVKSLEDARRTTLARFLVSLGIRHVGETVAQQLADEFGDLEPLLEADIERMGAVEGIGPTIAESVVRFFADARNREEVERLGELGLHWEPSPEPDAAGSDVLADLAFVVTGTLSESREAIKDRITGAGGKVTTSLSKKTSYLVAGENPGSKVAKAEKLGVEIIDETALDALIAGEASEGSTE
jgi:DNA ligase (NAD+)